MLARRLGTAEDARVPGRHWEGSSHSHASPGPRFGDLENENKEGIALQKSAPNGGVVGSGGCHVHGFLNLRRVGVHSYSVCMRVQR